MTSEYATGTRRLRLTILTHSATYFTVTVTCAAKHLAKIANNISNIKSKSEIVGGVLCATTIYLAAIKYSVFCVPDMCVM